MGRDMKRTHTHLMKLTTPSSDAELLTYSSLVPYGIPSSSESSRVMMRDPTRRTDVLAGLLLWNVHAMGATLRFSSILNNFEDRP